ncbi:MAG: acyltransferase family protein [Croceibacterium sp.]
MTWEELSGKHAALVRRTFLFLVTFNRASAMPSPRKEIADPANVSSEVSMPFENDKQQLRISKMGYNPSIDGMRALAVAAVFIFHLKRDWLRGGFTGVDVFFVISGYLITSILTDFDHRPSLLKFYQNRIARIFPAAVLTICVTLILGLLFYDNQNFAYLGTAAMFSALSLINMKLIFQSSYFIASSEVQPLLHYWPLAVEEQFYVIYPILITLLIRWRHPLVVWLAIGAALSFGLNIALTIFNPVFAFYLFPTRAWELLAGGLLATTKFRSTRIIPDVQGWAGLCIIALGFVFVSEARSFPGWQALIPVVGTVLMLSSVSADSTVARVFAAPPAVWLGRRSYAFYLWHWPVLSFVDYVGLQTPELVRAVVKVSITMCLTAVSYRIYELPLRKLMRQRTWRTATYATFACGILLISAAGYYARNHYYLSAEGKQLDRGGFLAGPAEGPRVTFLGDSIAAMYGTALRDENVSLRVRLLGAAATNELPNQVNTRWGLVRQWFDRDKPKVAIIAEAWSSKLGDGRDLDAALDALDERKIHGIIVLQPPTLSDDFNTALVRREMIRPRLQPVTAQARRLDVNRTVAEIARRHGSTVFDPAPLFLNARNEVIVASGPTYRLDYVDSVHLSDRGARRVIAKLLPVIERAIASPER